MVTQGVFKAHFNQLYAEGAIYVWGGNCEIISTTMIEKLFKTYGSATYDKKYYEDKLAEGCGKMGADCSGAIFPLSGKDDGASGYYRNQCAEKGAVSQMPMDTACLVFNSNFTHVGAYMGDGYTIEMANSQKNCVRSKFDPYRWAYYGIPTWLENPARDMNHNIDTSVVTNVQKWVNNYLGQSEIKLTGDFNTETLKGLCKCLQKCLNEEFGQNLDVDGSFGPKTKEACVSASKSKTLTYICQALLCMHNCYVGHSLKDRDFDGIYGSGMKQSVMDYQQKTRGLRQDGDCGPATFYALFNNQ